MAYGGIFSSDSSMPGDRPGDFATAIARLFPNGKAPLLALSSGMASEDITDTVKVWFEEAKLSRRVQVTSGGGINSSATTLNLQSAGQIHEGNVLLVETSGEHLLVTAVSGDQLTIVRGLAGTTASSIANSAFLSIIGSAFAEGSSRPRAINTMGQPVMNFTQIFRDSWDITGTARAVNYRTGDKLAKSRRDCMDNHAESMERALLFGRKEVRQLNNQPLRLMNGLRSFITTNVVAQSGDTSFEDLMDFAEKIFSRNIQGAPNERVAFCGNSVISTLNKLAKNISDIQLVQRQAEFGWSIWNWMTPFGDLALKTHPLLVEHPIWTKDLYVFHPGAFKTLYLRRTLTEDSTTNSATRNGVDADFGTLTTEMTCQYTCEETAGLFTGIDTPSAT